MSDEKKRVTDAECAEYLRACMQGVLVEEKFQQSALENANLREVLAIFKDALK